MLCVLSSICLRIDTSSFIVCGNKPVVPDGASTVSDSDCKLDRNGYKMWAVRFISVSHVDWAADINSSEGRGGLNRVSVYSSRANTTVLAAPTVQTTDLPGKWQYSRCLACVYIAYIRCRCSRFIRSSVNLRLIMCSRTVSSSQTITRLKTAFLNAQPLDTPPRVWNLVKSAVCDPLFRGRALSLCSQKHF